MSSKNIFAKRTNWPLEINQISERLSYLKKNKIPYIDLTLSNPTRCGFDYPSKEILSALSDERAMEYYPESFGLDDARNAVCDYYRKKGLKVDKNQIILTSSTSEAYSYLFRLLANPNDRVLFPQPSYPLFEFLVDLHDLRMGYYTLNYDGAWGLGEDFLNNFDKSTRAFILVNPNNPTGSYIKFLELARINDLCDEYEVPIICDEVFHDFPFNEKLKPISMVTNNKVLTFTLGGLSKSLGLPQMKLSWIVINGPVNLVEEAKKRLEIIADTYLSVNTPAQLSLRQWFTLKDNIQSQIKSRILNNYHFAQQQVKLLKRIQLLDVEGGWYITLKLSTSRNEDEWVLKLLNNYHVYVHPGYFFDFDQGNHLIVSLLGPQEAFQEGLTRVLSRIEQEGG